VNIFLILLILLSYRNARARVFLGISCPLSQVARPECIVDRRALLNQKEDRIDRGKGSPSNESLREFFRHALFTMTFAGSPSASSSIFRGHHA